MKIDLGKTIKWVVITGIAGGIAWAAWATWQKHLVERDNDLSKSDVVIEHEEWGDGYRSVRHLAQGWNDWQTAFFYNTTQGSDLLPYDFFMELQREDGKGLVRGDANIDRLRYLPRKPTVNNPEGLPVGFVKDNFSGRNYFGLTCAACHTTQVVHDNVALRIEGGPALADMDGFMRQLQVTLAMTKNDVDGRREPFVKAVLARGDYTSRDAVLADLDTYARRLALYNAANRSVTLDRKTGATIPVEYGHARLDAFGRIFNRVLENLITPEDLKRIAGRLVPDPAAYTALAGAIDEAAKGDRDGLVKRIQFAIDGLPGLSGPDKRKLEQAMLGAVFNPPNAPVSYPFLWDIVQHDYVQWNGIAANGGVGPLGRNTGEVIGVFATLDWKKRDGWSLAGWLGGIASGNKTGNRHIQFTNSADIANLDKLERQLASLTSPAWPADVLGKVDRALALRGEGLFATYCLECHAEIDANNPDRRVIANFTKLPLIGTDPTMASNATGRTGYSGLVLNQYVAAGPGKLLIQEKAPVAALLTNVTLNVVVTPDPDAPLVRRWAGLIGNLVSAYRENPISDSLKAGNYQPDTSITPYASLGAYKGRPLNGIWATAPYLHNGSVPTLYDLLLPPCPAGAKTGAGKDCRPVEFKVGSRRLDTEKVGLASDGYAGFVFNTGIPGNSNAGHEYGTKETVTADGTILPALTHADRLALVEYMKVTGLDACRQDAVFAGRSPDDCGKPGGRRGAGAMSVANR